MNLKRVAFFLLLLPLSPTAAAAAQDLADYDYANLSLRGIGLDYARIWPTKVEATDMLSARVDLGFLGPGVRLMPGISYWSSELNDRELRRFADQLNRLEALRDRQVAIDAAELGEVTWKDLSLALDLHLVWTTTFMRAFTYLGGGLSLHLMNGQGASVNDTFVEDLLDATPAGLAFMGGVELQPIPGVRFFGEARYTVMSDLRYPGIRLGATLMLARPDSSARGER